MIWSISFAQNPQLDDWLKIHTDGLITVYTGKVELGQKIRTALTLIAAAELDVAVERIELATVDTRHSPNEMFTSGSGSMEESGHAIRHACAHARTILLQLAAEQFAVSIDQLTVDDGEIRAPGRNDWLTYWQLMGDKNFACPVSQHVKIKTGVSYQTIKPSCFAPEMRDLVTGKPYFVQDMELPDMLHARVVRPPNYHARLQSVVSDPMVSDPMVSDPMVSDPMVSDPMVSDPMVSDPMVSDSVSSMPGFAALVQDGSFLAVAAEREEQAIRAAEKLALRASWKQLKPLVDDNIFQQLLHNRRTSWLVIDGVPGEQTVVTPEIPAQASITLQAQYQRPYHMHAALAPSAALAQLENGRLTVWTHGQGVFPLRMSIAQVLEMAEDDIRVIHVPGSGCYGHNGADDAALDAALVARQVAPRPVLLKWSRQDEHGWEPYSSAMVMKLQASLDEDGEVLDWRHETYSDTHVTRPRMKTQGRSGMLAAWHLETPLQKPDVVPNMKPHGGIHRNSDPLYKFAQKHIVKHLVHDLPLRVSATRSLGAFANVFAAESFMDELAQQAGVDALEFRLRYLQDQRARAVLQAAAEQADWGKSLADNHGQGLAFAQYKNVKCYTAVVMDVSVDDYGTIRLEKAVIASDSGHIVDHDGLRSQLEGGLIQAASWTLKEQVSWDKQAITSRDWDSYPILRFSEIPTIETILLDQPGQPFLGSGEGTLGPTPAAIANAVYAATGLRLRTLPFTAEQVRKAAAES